MGLLHRRLRRWLLAIPIMMLVGCAALEVALLRSPSRGEVLLAARERWAARPFARYRLVTEHFNGMNTCRQDVEVAGEQVVEVYRNTCSRAPVTVASLFLEIERYSATIGGRCGPNGCGCDGPIDVDATYDARLGHPRHFEVRLKPEARWQHLDYWGALLTGGTCRAIEFGGRSVSVISVAPIHL